MLTITQALQDDIGHRVQNQGKDLYYKGAVTIQSGNQSSVQAIVDGYAIELELGEDHVRAWCNCNQLYDYSKCKHIWAAVVASEKQGYLYSGHLSEPLCFIDDVEFDDEFDDDYQEFRGGWGSPPFLLSYENKKPKNQQSPQEQPPAWKQQLAQFRRNQSYHSQPVHSIPAQESQLLYVMEQPYAGGGGGLKLQTAVQVRKKNGEWGKPRFKEIPRQSLTSEDRRILATIYGAHSSSYGYAGYNYQHVSIGGPLLDELIPAMCRTGRCFMRSRESAYDLDDLQNITWDEGVPWELWLVFESTRKGNYRQVSQLRRHDERCSLKDARFFLNEGFVFFDERAARFDHGNAFQWVSALTTKEPPVVPQKDIDAFLHDLLTLPNLPNLDIPEELKVEYAQETPLPRLTVSRDKQSDTRLNAKLEFDYAGQIIAADHQGEIYLPESRRLIRRDRNAELEATTKLHWFGVSRDTYPPYHMSLPTKKLPHLVSDFTAAGWVVEADGKLMRTAGNFHMEVSSGIDWFELEGGVSFGDSEAKLPELLAALARGDDTIRLDDGSFGMLPKEWLRKYGLLAGVGNAENGSIRFSKAQVGLLDALLASQPEVTFDETFARARDELQQFKGIKTVEPPKGFTGELRPYQKDGLGWLGFLDKFSFGGCLADDMGLGKTVMVLALLESRRKSRTGKSANRPRPSLAVVPRSLIFNWQQEAERFTPKLKVLDHSGLNREPPGSHFDDHDLILTTYGILRRDALQFKDLEFDYCILDEAQAVKNASTEAAKAVRLIKAQNRLTLSGTPIENHLGELWSMFDFLNPGMLGSKGMLQVEGGWRNPTEETRTILSKALRPFILRRTKEQVAKDLPAKLEQTMWCELEADQRKLYNELRDHFRRSLLERIDKEGIKKSKIQIIEALLRLRQAAIHPGLIDKKKESHASAKLDMLLPQLKEVHAEGHKALVFSQFTSMLTILRQHLDKDKISYQYLDGKTRDRQGRVDAFQTDPDCKLFLISLKAGGLGLNLTAADYVFLLDPWWNPAVEAQAIDRAHRIGQSRQVFAYRLIAKDTVEEKVLALQDSKRNLADAIINADNSLIRDLKREDLELLLG